jgi:hypothetical protein
MLELVYLNLFDYLARPNAAERAPVPDDAAVAAAIAILKKLSEQDIEKVAARR